MDVLGHLYYNWNSTVRIPTVLMYAGNMSQFMGHHATEGTTPGHHVRKLPGSTGYNAMAQIIKKSRHKYVLNFDNMARS